MRKWLFGTTDYVHGWMRWVAGPAWRLGILMVGITLATTGHGSWVSWAGSGLMVIGFSMDLVNVALLRARAGRRTS